MSEVIEKIYTLLEPLLDNTEIIFVNIKIKPTNNVKVFLDADSGFSIDKSASINRKLHHLLETSGVISNPIPIHPTLPPSPGDQHPIIFPRENRQSPQSPPIPTTYHFADISKMIPPNP